MTPADRPATSEERVEQAARALNDEGWTCENGEHEPGHYDDCEECRRDDRLLATAALTAAGVGELEARLAEGERVAQEAVTDLIRLTIERDDALAEVARLRAQEVTDAEYISRLRRVFIDAERREQNAGCRVTAAHQEAVSVRRDLAHVAGERDAALAQVEAVRALADRWGKGATAYAKTITANDVRAALTPTERTES